MRVTIGLVAAATALLANGANPDVQKRNHIEHPQRASDKQS